MTAPSAPATTRPAAMAELPTSSAPPGRAVDPATLLADLDAGRLRAAHPDGGAPGGWRVDPTVKTAIIARFADRGIREWTIGDLFAFRDRASLPMKDLVVGDVAVDPALDRRARIVPGGTSIRAGVRIGAGVIVMPPAFINVGAWIGDDAMIDSHVLVGSCAQIGARVHLAAGVQVGGVLEPPGARPVIVEDDAFVGAGSHLLEGVVVGRRSVIAAGVTLTGTSRVYDTVRETVLEGTPSAPLVIPPGAVVVAGARALGGTFAAAHRLSVRVPLIVKDRDDRTDARVALEEALR